MKPRHLILAVLCALLIAYPLSIGPMAKWYYRDHPLWDPGPSWVQVTYAPLIWAVQHSDGVRKAYFWYMQRWGVEIEG